MASRLTVVVSQSAQHDPQASDLEETLVAEVMMTNGMDATMVGPLVRVDPSDTDFLCLSSFNHSFVLFGWESLENANAQWQRLGLPGQVVDAQKESPHNGSPASPSANGHKTRRIYYFQLNPESRVPPLLDQLNALLTDRQTKIVPLGLSLNGLGLKPGVKQAPSSASPPPTLDGGPSPAADNSPASASASASSTKTVDGASSSNSNTPATSASQAEDSDDDDGEWSELDRLVDDLDQLDL